MAGSLLVLAADVWVRVAAAGRGCSLLQVAEGWPDGAAGAQGVAMELQQSHTSAAASLQGKIMARRPDIDGEQRLSVGSPRC